jgi:hypothetical protein
MSLPGLGELSSLLAAPEMKPGFRRRYDHRMPVASWKDLPGPVRAIGTVITRTVEAAAGQDRDGYRDACADLVALPTEATWQVLAAVIRTLLEETHPDGLDSDDIQAVLSRCFRDTTSWLPLDQLDAHTLIAVLASALGIHEPGVTYTEITTTVPATGDDWAADPVGGSIIGGGHTDAAAPSPVPTAEAYARHAPLLIADLLTGTRRRLSACLDTVFTDIARAETMEMP